MESKPSSKTFKSYIFFWMGQIFSLLGSSIVQFVIPVWITLIFQDEILTSLVYFVSFIPPIIISPIAGVFADRLDRKKLIAVADSSQALTTLILIMFFMTNSVNFTIILIINFVRAMFQAIHFAPSNAIIPTMVPEKHLSRMNGINYLFTSFINIIGPLIGGVVIFFFPIEIALWIDILTFLIAVFPLIIIKIPDIRKDHDKDFDISVVQHDIKEGISTLNMIPGMIVLLLLATLANFLQLPLQTLLPNFIIIDNSGTELIYAIVSSSISMGILIGSIIVTIRQKWKKKVLIIVSGILIENVGYLLVAISPYRFFMIMVIGGFLSSVFLPIVNTMFLTILQTNIPVDRQGRVISLTVMISSGIAPISIILAGPLSKIIGISTLWFSYAVIGIITCLVMWFSTDLRYIDEFEEEPINLNSKVKQH